MQLKIYIHIIDLPGWRTLLSDQLRKIDDSGLGSTATEINFCMNGPLSSYTDWIETEMTRANGKFIHVCHDYNLYEYPTLSFLKRECDALTDTDVAVLYLHPKGISQVQRNNTWVPVPQIQDWRNFMEYWVIERWQECVQKLETNDAVGVNFRTWPWPHFSGNMWWATASYIKKLPVQLHPDMLKARGYKQFLPKVHCEWTKAPRFDCESWIGTGIEPFNAKLYEIDSSPNPERSGWHYHHPWPRHKYEKNTK